MVSGTMDSATAIMIWEPKRKCWLFTNSKSNKIEIARSTTERQREREKDRQTDRQTDREEDKYLDLYRLREIKREIKRLTKHQPHSITSYRYQPFAKQSKSCLKRL